MPHVVIPSMLNSRSLRSSNRKKPESVLKLIVTLVMAPTNIRQHRVTIVLLETLHLEPEISLTRSPIIC